MSIHDSEPFFVDVVARNLNDPDEVQRHRINHGRDKARKWLINFQYAAVRDGWSVTVTPAEI